jgi:hypothetical protein
MDLKNPKASKKRKLQAGWSVETHDDLFRTYERAPIPVPKSCNSVMEQIFREIWYRYQLRKRAKEYQGVEAELAAAMATEITAEIDKQILADLTKALGVSKGKI